MPVKKKEIPVIFRLSTIETLDMKLVCPSSPPVIPIKYSFTVNVGRNVDIEKRFVIIFVEIIIASGEEPKNAGSLKISLVYEVENFELFIDKKSGLVKFPADFDQTLNNISISTARGVMFAQFRGTFLHSAILPIINPKDLVPGEKTI